MQSTIFYSATNVIELRLKSEMHVSANGLNHVELQTAWVKAVYSGEAENILYFPACEVEYLSITPIKK